MKMGKGTKMNIAAVKKTLLPIMCAMLVIGAFGACGGGGSGGTPATQAQDAGAAQGQGSGAQAGNAALSADDAKELSGDIVVWSWVGQQLADTVVPAFNKLYPNIKVDSQNVSNDELKAKLLATTAAGSGAPDVSLVQGDDIVQFITNGGLTDLSPWMEQLKGDFPVFKIANDTGEDGKIYAVPVDVGPCAMFYRTDLFEQAGVQPPQTWEEFLAAAPKFTEKGLYLHRANPNGEMELLRMMVQQQGGSCFDADGNATLDTPEFRKALEFQIKMLESNSFLDVSNWTPAYDEEMQGNRLASHVGAAWYMNTFTNQWPEASTNWAIAPMPYFDGAPPASANNGGAEMVIPEQSKNKDAAWAFINFHCATVEGRLAASEGMGEFGSYLPAYDSADMQNATVKFFGDQKVYVFFSEQLNLIPANFRIPAPYNEVQTLINGVLAPIMSGEVTIDAGIADLQAQAETVVSKY
jgi:ABC-type glycerol-3-phosphate transport system substrate-binding protein